MVVLVTRSKEERRDKLARGEKKREYQNMQQAEGKDAIYIAEDQQWWTQLWQVIGYRCDHIVSSWTARLDVMSRWCEPSQGKHYLHPFGVACYVSIYPKDKLPAQLQLTRPWVS
jgi:hypothetical protein